MREAPLHPLERQQLASLKVEVGEIEGTRRQRVTLEKTVHRRSPYRDRRALQNVWIVVAMPLHLEQRRRLTVARNAKLRHPTLTLGERRVHGQLGRKSGQPPLELVDHARVRLEPHNVPNSRSIVRFRFLASVCA